MLDIFDNSNEHFGFFGRRRSRRRPSRRGFLAKLRARAAIKKLSIRKRPSRGGFLAKLRTRAARAAIKKSSIRKKLSKKKRPSIRKKLSRKKRPSRKKKTYKAKKDIPINTNDVIKDDISTNVSEIKLSGTDKSVGSTNDLKTPDMTMNLDLKDDTKFELFSNKNDKAIQTKINNNSNIFIIFLVTCLLIGIFNLH